MSKQYRGHLRTRIGDFIIVKDSTQELVGTFTDPAVGAAALTALNEHDLLVAVAEAANELQYTENAHRSHGTVSVVVQAKMTALREALTARAAACNS